jgi:hypothetical protein
LFFYIALIAQRGLYLFIILCCQLLFAAQLPCVAHCGFLYNAEREGDLVCIEITNKLRKSK